MARLSAARAALNLLLLPAFALLTSSSARPAAIEHEQTQSQTQVQSQSPDKSRVQAQKDGSQGAPKPADKAIIGPPSLGELARQQRAQRDKNPSLPLRVFTNDNLPKSSDELSIVGPPPAKEPASTGAESDAKTAGRLRRRITDLQQNLETHQRELAVLQQKLGENQLQYYPNPNDTLHQEYSREDIDRVTLAIDQKKQQIDADQQALSEAQDELAGQGLAPSQPGAARESLSKPDLSGVKEGSEEYWRLRFKAAREALARAQEQEKLAEDELALLQSQQAHEIASGGAGAYDPQITAKQSEIEAKRAAVAKAQQELDALELEFAKSGSPQAWSE